MILFYTIQVYSDLASPFDLAQDMLLRWREDYLK
jgi:hypothetical protein